MKDTELGTNDSVKLSSGCSSQSGNLDVSRYVRIVTSLRQIMPLIDEVVQNLVVKPARLRLATILHSRELTSNAKFRSSRRRTWRKSL